MKYVIEGIGAFVGVIAVALFLSFVMAWPVMMLWNGCFVGAIDGVREIGWLQAWGLQFLFALLFKTTVTKKD
jgi:uncharacterized membrane protein SpoIIM required for sporulation